MPASSHHNHRDEVIARVLSQVTSQVEAIRNQALLTLEETRKREDSARRAAERVTRAEEIAWQSYEDFARERAEKETLGRQNPDEARSWRGTSEARGVCAGEGVDDDGVTGALRRSGEGRRPMPPPEPYLLRTGR